MRRYLPIILLAAALILGGGGLWWALAGDMPDPASCLVVDRLPRIQPDYIDVAVPPNIAPLNFVIEEPGTRFHVAITGEGGGRMELPSHGPSIRLPLRAWRDLLNRNRGKDLKVTVFAKGKDGRWSSFQPIQNCVAEEPIDPYVSYRLITPAYFWFHDDIEMGIYQRNVESFDEAVLLHNSSFRESACFNCHAFAANRPSTMVLHLRGDIGPAMLVNREGRLARIGTRSNDKHGPVSMSSLHPSGKQLAFASPDLGLFSKSAGEPREVFEFQSDVGIYRTDKNEFVRVPGLSSTSHAETFPAWSGDGKHLYFCRAKIQWPIDAGEKRRALPGNYRDVRYDLMRIAYDETTDTWGEPEVMLSAKQLGKSISQPAVSPDGRFVVFCAMDYGVWPLTRPEADLYLMDTTTGKYEPMACNTPGSESLHDWSSNGRWLIFSSKRKDGVFTRLYFTHVDENGKSSRAVELPQEDAAAEVRFLKAYSIPEFMTGPVTIPEGQLIGVIQEGLSAKRQGTGPGPGSRTAY